MEILQTTALQVQTRITVECADKNYSIAGTDQTKLAWEYTDFSGLQWNVKIETTALQVQTSFRIYVNRDMKYILAK